MAPQSPAQMGKLQQRLVAAGYRNHEAIAVFFRHPPRLRAVFALGVALRRKPNLPVALAACGLGYLLPGMALGRMAKRRQHRIRLGLPDALDLLVVSVEAGPRPRSGDPARRRRARLRAPGSVGRAAADQPRAARGQGTRRRAEEPRRAHGRGRHRVARRDARADRQVRHQRRAVAARPLRHRPHEAAAARRRGRGEDRRQDGVPAGVLHLPAIWVVTIGPAAIKFIQVSCPMANK